MATFSPYVITNAQDSFSVQSLGYWQGDVLADPATRFSISAANVAATEALPMWGGVAIYETAPPVQPAGGFNGSIIGRALSNSKIAGFSTNVQSFSAPTTPQSPVPLQSAGGAFNFVRLGSGNRVVVPCSSGVLSLANYNPQSFSWDPVNQQLVPYSALGGSGVAVSAYSWSGGVLTVTTGSAHGLTTGDYATVAGAVPTGFNVSGAVTVTSTTAFTLPAPINPGTATTNGSVYTGLGGFSASLIALSTASGVVVYNSTTGFATWNTTGNAAVILI